MRCFLFASIVTVVALSSQSFGQIVYLPVQYQYGTQSKIYYGGSDPRVIAHADEWRCERQGEPERVYSDNIPGQNTRAFGYTANDARNDAYQNAARYFRKADVAALAVPTSGGWVVPAQVGEVSDDGRYYRASHRVVQDHVQATAPKPLMIIPKNAIEKPVAPKTKVVSIEK